MFLRARKKEEIEIRKKEIVRSLDSLFWKKDFKRYLNARNSI